MIILDSLTKRYGDFTAVAGIDLEGRLSMCNMAVEGGAKNGIIEADDLARIVVEGLSEERFHILPHPEVENYVRRKGDDIDRWLAGMRRLRERSLGD